jgi:hypothetical protein
MNGTHKGWVIRWKLAIQEFNFAGEHIPGKDNIVADQLSRKLPRDTVNTGEEQLTADATGEFYTLVVQKILYNIANSVETNEELAAEVLQRSPDDILLRLNTFTIKLWDNMGLREP